MGEFDRDGQVKKLIKDGFKATDTQDELGPAQKLCEDWLAIAPEKRAAVARSLDQQKRGESRDIYTQVERGGTVVGFRISDKPNHTKQAVIMEPGPGTDIPQVLIYTTAQDNVTEVQKTAADCKPPEKKK